MQDKKKHAKKHYLVEVKQVLADCVWVEARTEKEAETLALESISCQFDYISDIKIVDIRDK